jgi:FixJ family two-component response regulator
MTEARTVFIVDDDEGARRSVCALVESMGLRAESFASAEEFLAHYTADRPGCLVTDLRMIGMSGLELQERLIQQHISIPVIVLTAFARTSVTVRAVKVGAVAVLDKPYTDDDLWDAISAALAKDATERETFRRDQAIQSQFEQLTTLERRVLAMIVQGRPNKAIAQTLDISVRSVANHRSKILAKTGATSTAELIRLAIASKLDERWGW